MATATRSGPAVRSGEGFRLTPTRRIPIVLAVKKQYLLAPGPTPIPPAVSAALAAPIDHHRKAEFKAVFEEVAAGLRWIFQTEQPVISIAGSGTAAMDAAVTTFLARGDVVVVVQGGKFGERWTQICRAYGVEVELVEVPWGHGVAPEAVAQALARRPEARAVLVQASETSTGAAHPIRELAALTRERPETLLFVDGISAVCAMDLPMDEWGIDVLVSGAQKGFMIPPGLAFLAASERAWAAAERSDLPSFFLDMRRERAKTLAGTTAWTPAIGLFYALRVAIQMMREEGLKEMFARHERLAAATRAGAEAMGLALFAGSSPSPSLTSICVPEGVDGNLLVNRMRSAYGVTVAGGQDELKGKILRLAHLGYADRFDVIVGLTSLAATLTDLGRATDAGAGVNAALAVLLPR